MRQVVTVTRRADRHAEDHERDFADSERYFLPAGDLAMVLIQMYFALAQSDRWPRGSYVIEIEEPHE